MNSKQAKVFTTKYGADYFSRIGKKGAESFWKKYTVQPVGTSQFGIFRRDDNTFVNFFGSGGQHTNRR